MSGFVPDPTAWVDTPTATCETSAGHLEWLGIQPAGGATFTRVRDWRPNGPLLLTPLPSQALPPAAATPAKVAEVVEETDADEGPPEEPFSTDWGQWLSTTTTTRRQAGHHLHDRDRGGIGRDGEITDGEVEDLEGVDAIPLQRPRPG